jgi:TolB-like protein/Flp pilus assembly protein TadD
MSHPIGVHRVHLADDAVPPRSVQAGAKSEQSSSQPSIVVLPFVNMSGDAEQEYFADGIAEDIITGISKLRWFFVIARNSAFTYKGRAVDVKKVASELGVRYVLEGSVRKGGNRVRITAQLIDAATGNHIWADRYDGDLSDVFALQDDITRKVVAAIEPKLLEAEGIRSQGRSPEDFDAWETVAHANSLFWRVTRSEGESAIAMLRNAVRRYPGYGPAHSTLAFMLIVSGYLGWDVIEPRTKEALSLATRAAELDHSDPWAHLALGYVALSLRRTEEAAEEFRRAIELNPNFAAAHGYLGFAQAMAGDTEHAIVHVEQAIRMSPHDPQNAIFNVGLAVAHYLAGRYDEAIAFGRKALQQRVGMTGGHRIYVASLAQAGRLEEATTALERLRELQPELSIAWCKQYVPYTPATLEAFLDGMRKAGLT